MAALHFGFLRVGLLPFELARRWWINYTRRKALNMDHFYKNIRNMFLLQQIGTIFIVSVAYSNVDIVLEH